jgi:hypothetical protein
LTGRERPRRASTSTLYDAGDSPTGSSSQDFPIQNGYNKEYPLAQPTGSGFGPKNTEDHAFNIGE